MKTDLVTEARTAMTALMREALGQDPGVGLSVTECDQGHGEEGWRMARIRLDVSVGPRTATRLTAAAGRLAPQWVPFAALPAGRLAAVWAVDGGTLHDAMLVSIPADRELMRGPQRAGIFLVVPEPGS